MKPSVILYKALPDDLLQRLQEHFTVHQVANLSPQTVEQNAAIFAEAEGLLGSNENVDAALLEKMPKLRATSTISVGYDNFDVDALTARKILPAPCRSVPSRQCPVFYGERQCRTSPGLCSRSIRLLLPVLLPPQPDER